MTDKQIIIDGVDVSGCEFYQIEANELYPKANYCGSMRNTFCEIEPNCYYKNWQRKEQECEELKDLNTRLDNQRETYWKGYQKLSKTLTEIKEIAESEIDSKEFMTIQCMLNGSIDNKNKVLQQILQKISECEGK